MNKKLTIVIPCKNEKQGIINVLKLLRKQRLDCLVIVADSSDDEESIKLLKDYSSHPSFFFKTIKGGLPSEARNNGAKLAKTPYVLFLDADVYLKESDFISQCLKEIEESECDLLTCKFKTISGSHNWVYRIFHFAQKLISKNKPFALGGFMLFRTKTFLELGGFDEKAKVAEDYLLSMKVSPDKFKISKRYAYTPNRRFKNKGVFYMFKLAISCWMNRNNPNFFKNDQGYWK